MGIELVLVAVISLTYLFIAYLTIAKNSHVTVNKLFSLLALLLFFWSAFSYLEDAPLGITASKLFLQLELALGILISFTFLIFSIHFPKKIIGVNNIFLSTIALACGFLALASFTPLIAHDITYTNGIIFIEGILFPLYAILATLNFLLGIGIIIFKYPKLDYTGKQQSLYLTYGFSISVAIALIFNLVIPNVTNIPGSISRIGIYGNLFLVLAVGYAIVRHRLLDIKFIVARTVAYSLLLIIVALFYVGSAIVLSNTLLKTTTTSAQLIEFTILTLIVAFTFQPLRKFLEKSTDRLFFKGDYDFNGILSKLTRIMAETILIDDIAHKLLNILVFEMKITRGAFVLTDAGKIFVTETQGYKEKPSFTESEVFSLQAVDKTLIFEDLIDGSIKDLMRKLDVTVVVPLKTQVDHVGLLFLGEKSSGEVFSDKDLKVLNILAPEVAISFENAKSVEKIRRFNITLKEQVERATHELKDANEQLKELDKLKDEFLSVASHDLRTPMTAIKGYLWMAINDRAGKITNPALKRYLEISYTSAERMIALINDLLNVSRIKAGRMQMVFEGLDLKPLMDQIFAEIMSKAAEKKILLKYEAEASLPKVTLDKQRFPEILQNLIGNAIKFTPEKGKITVSAKKSKEPDMVEISVTDTGVGLSKEDSSKLFEKYGRIERSYTAAKTSGGTGLGLYITKNYVDMHGGKIWVESEVGKGTTFIFTLRVADEGKIKEMNSKNQPPNAEPTVPKVDTTIAKEAIAK